MRVAIAEGDTSPQIYLPPRKGGKEATALMQRYGRAMLPLDAMLVLAGVAFDDFALAHSNSGGEITPEVMVKQKFAFALQKDAAHYMHGKQMTVKLDNRLDEHENSLLRLEEARKNVESGVYEIDNWELAE